MGAPEGLRQRRRCSKGRGWKGSWWRACSYWARREDPELGSLRPKRAHLEEGLGQGYKGGPETKNRSVQATGASRVALYANRVVGGPFEGDDT